MKEYPVDVMVVFVFGISGLFVAGVAGLVMAQDLDAWKLQPNLLLVTILYMGFSSGFLNVVIQIWTLRLKGPVYVAMFKPLTIVIAIVMGVLFLGDLLHLGRLHYIITLHPLISFYFYIIQFQYHHIYYFLHK